MQAMMVETMANVHCQGCTKVIRMMRASTLRLRLASGMCVFEASRLKSVASVAALVVTYLIRAKITDVAQVGTAAKVRGGMSLGWHSEDDSLSRSVQECF